MYQSINFSDFRNAFKQLRPSNFSNEGLCELFEYCEDYERDSGDPMELDVIALCCDITEDQPLSIANGYNIDLSEIDLNDVPKVRETVLGYLCEHTTVIGQTDDSILFVNF